ncbi:hypothetical protein [Carboxylicivirga caseinilyticus]|uniref:hypothetical protein n=1 Tax=Carboxylicivirga caseinilyticus TaxID=3417572 RepID=UPI003D350365|nr:hypothetical protein [Marinilabiliaceae bacterium A049]
MSSIKNYYKYLRLKNIILLLILFTVISCEPDKREDWETNTSLEEDSANDYGHSLTGDFTGTGSILDYVDDSNSNNGDASVHVSQSSSGYTIRLTIGDYNKTFSCSGSGDFTIQGINNKVSGTINLNPNSNSGNYTNYKLVEFEYIEQQKYSWNCSR